MRRFRSEPGEGSGLAAECRARSGGSGFEVGDTEDGLRGFEVADADGYVLFLGHPLEPWAS